MPMEHFACVFLLVDVASRKKLEFSYISNYYFSVLDKFSLTSFWLLSVCNVMWA